MSIRYIQSENDIKLLYYLLIVRIVISEFLKVYDKSGFPAFSKGLTALV